MNRLFARLLTAALFAATATAWAEGEDSPEEKTPSYRAETRAGVPRPRNAGRYERTKTPQSQRAGTQETGMSIGRGAETRAMPNPNSPGPVREAESGTKKPGSGRNPCVNFSLQVLGRLIQEQVEDGISLQGSRIRVYGPPPGPGIERPFVDYLVTESSKELGISGTPDEGQLSYVLTLRARRQTAGSLTGSVQLRIRPGEPVVFPGLPNPENSEVRIFHPLDEVSYHFVVDPTPVPPAEVQWWPSGIRIDAQTVKADTETIHYPTVSYGLPRIFGRPKYRELMNHIRSSRRRDPAFWDRNHDDLREMYRVALKEHLIENLTAQGFQFDPSRITPLSDGKYRFSFQVPGVSGGPVNLSPQDMVVKVYAPGWKNLDDVSTLQTAGMRNLTDVQKRVIKTTLVMNRDLGMEDYALERGIANEPNIVIPGLLREGIVLQQDQTQKGVRFLEYIRLMARELALGKIERQDLLDLHADLSRQLDEGAQGPVTQANANRYRLIMNEEVPVDPVAAAERAGSKDNSSVQTSQASESDRLRRIQQEAETHVSQMVPTALDLHARNIFILYKNAETRELPTPREILAEMRAHSQLPATRQRRPNRFVRNIDW